jgi:hypothetical protein
MYFMLLAAVVTLRKALNKSVALTAIYSASLNYPPTKKPCHDGQGFLLFLLRRKRIDAARFRMWLDVASGEGGDADCLALQRAFRAEGNLAGDLCKQCVVLAHADIRAGMNLRAALTDDDAARRNQLSAEALHAEPLGI